MKSVLSVTTILAVVALSMSSCNKDEEDPTGMKVVQIFLSDWPNSNWDNLSEADIYMSIWRQASSSYIIQSTNQCNDCVSSATFTFSAPPIMDVNELFDFDCYDYDSTDPNDYMGGIINFRPADYMDSRPSSINLQSTSFTIRLTVEWI